MEDPEQLTQSLRRLASGDPAAKEALYPLIYPELRRIAAQQLRLERPGHTLQPTALLHDAYLKLTRRQQLEFNDRGHFFALCAKMMRQILISHARAKQAGKRGGDHVRVNLESAANIAAAPEPMLLELDEALSCLEKESPRAYMLVELKFFAGFDFEEASEILGVSSRTLKRDWEYAKLWLYRRLSQG